MWVTAKQLENMGISPATIYRRTASGEWTSRRAKSAGRVGLPSKEILIKDLPVELQLKLTQLDETATSGEKPVEADGAESADAKTCVNSSPLDRLNQALKRIPTEEREVWMAELTRLSSIIERYEKIVPKRIKNSSTKKYEFAPAVLAICKEAACTNAIIIDRESGRAKPPSPFTLDGWLRDYRKVGLLAFIRALPEAIKKEDRRKAAISEAAAEWVNNNWRNYRNPTHLYKAAQKRAKKENWQLPSKVWFFRRWKELPKIVLTHHVEGAKAYVSKYAPYVPRDYSDLEALQIICGDHSERDLTVKLRDGSLARPWLTSWQDLRTGLIWGWHLDLVPSSHTAGMAYADGVMNFGAQPLSGQMMSSSVMFSRIKDAIINRTTGMERSSLFTNTR